MKAQFIVTIEGSWFEGDKRVTQADVQREVRDALKDRLEFLAKRTSVKPYKPVVPPDAVDRAAVLEEAAVICDDHHYNWRFGDGEDSTSGPKECAAAIRKAASQGVDSAALAAATQTEKK